MFATLALTATALVASAGVGADEEEAGGNPVTESSIDLTCRANSPIGVQTSDQTATYRVEQPEFAAQGESFDIVLRPGLSEFPTSAEGATIRKVQDIRTVYQIPEGLTVNSVTEEAPPGADTVGYYLPPGADREDPELREEIPGGTSAVYEPSTRYVRAILNGTGSPDNNAGEFRGGSAVQAPHVRVNVTVTAGGGTALNTELGGTLPSNPNTLPWADPSVVSTTRATQIINVTTTAFCAPFEGEDRVLASTTVVGPDITVASPIEDGNYAEGDEVEVDYACADGPDFEVDTCVASVDGVDIADGGLLDTDGLGSKEFVVTAESTLGNVATFTVPYNVVENSIPEVDAGPDQFDVPTSAIVTLSGTATDADGPPAQSLTTSWDQIDGPAVSLDDPSSLETTFEAPFEGPATLEFELSATDSVGGVGTDTVTVQVLGNRDPVAVVGDDQSVTIGQTVELDASASSDPDGHAITFSWEQTDGPAVALSNDDAAVASFVAPASAAGQLTTFEVTVSDDRGGVATATTTVEVLENQPPIANAGPNQTGIRTLNTVTLNGGASADPFGLDITYEWEQVSGVPVTLSDPTAVNPTFQVPPQPDFLYPHDIVFQLVVTDELGLSSAPDTVNVNVIATAPTVGTPSYTPGGNRLVREEIVWTAPLTNPDGYPVVWDWQMTRDGGVYLPPAGTGSGGNAGTFGPLTDPDPKMRLANATRTPSGFFGGTPPASPRVSAQAIAQLPGGGTLVSNTAEFTGNFRVDSQGSTPVVNSGPYQVVAAGSEVTLPGVAFPAGSTTPTYQWTQTAGEAVAIDDPTALVTSFTAPEDLGVLRFQLVMTQGSNTSIPSPLKITVVPVPPTADAGEDQSGFIVGDTVTLDATESAGDEGVELSYSWTQTSGPSVSLSGANTATPSFTAPGGPSTLTFQVTVGGDNTPLTTTDSVSVSVDNSAPTANAGPDQTVTEDDEVELDATGSTDPDGNPLSFSWEQISGPAVTINDANTATPTFIAPDGFSVSVFEVTVDDGFGGVDTDTVEITSLDRPEAVITAAPSGGLAPLVVGFSGQSSISSNGFVTGFEWDFGNGETGTGATASSTYTEPGIYEVTLTITDVLGAQDTATTTVQVFELPTASFTLPAQVEPDEVFTVDASGSVSPDGTIISYQWDFGNGQTATGVTASTSYPDTNTVQTITLTVTDNNGGVDTTTRTILVGNQLPTAAFSASPPSASGVHPLGVSFNASASTDVDGTIVSYEWDFGNGQTATGVNASTTFSDPGTFTVTLTVTDNDGGQDVATLEYVVGENQAPVANLNLTSTIGAAPFTLTADASNSFDVDGTITSYSFSLEGTTSTGQNISAGPVTGPAQSAQFSLPITGVYTITLVVTDDKGVTGTTSDTIQVGLAPQANFTATPTSGLNPLVVSVDASASVDLDTSIVSYEWDFGNGDTGSGVTASTTYADAGTYTITLTITDEIGLTDTATATVVVAQNQAPVASFIATPDTGLDPLVVDVDASGSTDDGEIVSYEWDFGNGDTGSGVTASTTYADPGTYEITLTVTDDKGVTGTTTRTVEVGENQPPVAAFTVTPTSGNIPLSVSVDAGASTDDGQIVSYEWDFGNGQTATGVTAGTSYEIAGTYTITLTVTDDKGLSDTTTQTVTAVVPVALRDFVNLRFTGAINYEYVGNTDANLLRITRDIFGPLRVRGTETFPSLVDGQADVRATLDRFLIFNAFTGTVRVRDNAAGLNATADVFLSGLATPSETSVRGSGAGNLGTIFNPQNFNLAFTIDDRS